MKTDEIEGKVDWRAVDWRLSDASLADSLGVSRQRVNKARQRCSADKAVRVKKTRRALDDMIDEMVGIISHYDPRTAEELAYNDGVKDMANTFRGWTLRARLDSQNAADQGAAVKPQSTTEGD